MKQYRVYRIFLGFLLTTAMLCPSVGAQVEQPAQNGYLIKLREGVELPIELFSDEEAPIQTYEFLDNVVQVDSWEALTSCLNPDWVEYIEPNYQMELFSVPDEEIYTGGLQWGLDAMGMNQVWDWVPTGHGVRVGVIDSGLYPQNPDLMGITHAAGYNYIEENQDIQDEIGHGTFVSSIIAAQRGNGIGIAGMVPDVSLVTLKCFEKSGSGSTADYGDIANAISACATSTAQGGFGCDVINMSFGGKNDSNILRAAVEEAVENGVILVAAVGNNKNTTLNYPAAYEGVIGVGSVQKSLERAASSNYNASVDVVAPGQGVYGLKNSEDPTPLRGSGTSYATPSVSAAAALVKCVAPEVDGADFLRLLSLTAKDLGSAGRDDHYGYGLLSIPELLMLAKEDAVLTVEPDGEHSRLVQVLSCNLPPNTEVVCIAASYDQNGRMSAVNQITGTADQTGTLSVERSLSRKGAETTIQVFFLEPGSMRPLRETIVHIL